jgi:Bacteriophytochrome (light-regulated signal transduction histidine kinase)
MQIKAAFWHRSGILVPATLLFLAAATIALVWTLHAAEIRREQERAHRTTSVRLESVTQALAEQTERTLTGINVAILYLRDAWLDGPEAFEQAIASVTPVVMAEGNFGVVVSDADGQAIYSSFSGSQGPANYADRDYFQAQREAADDSLFAGKPVMGRVSNRMIVPFSRKIVDARGRFAGVVAVTVPPEELIRIDEHMNMGPRAGVSVVGTDRVIRAASARMPGLGAVPVVGAQVPPDRPYFSADQGVFTATGSADGEARLFAFRRLKHFPLVVVATETLSDVAGTLATRRRELLALSALATGAIALFALTVAGLFRALAQRNRSLIEKSQALERSNNDLEQFAFVASHDLREPLRMVSSFMGLLERRLHGSLDDENRDYLAFARDGAMRMDQMVLDLLEYSRIGRERPPLQPVPLGKVVEQARHTLGAALEDVKGEIRAEGPLPTVAGDGAELGRLFQNLLGNALKYAATDRPPVVSVSARRDGEFWRLAVSDNGIGIAPEHFDKIFGVFQRLHTRDKYAGTGIGLAICKKVVEQHGGRIWVDSREGEGTTVFFTLHPAEGWG